MSAPDSPIPESDASLRQRLAAEPRVSAWVSANAGSGKTRVLVDRVARLLLAGSPPERILCLTYTKTAAAEMQKRLVGQLGSWTAMEDAPLAAALHLLERRPIDPLELPKARRLFARALETPGGLKISTIHAFCTKVLRRFPLEAGVAYRFELIDDTEAMRLRAEAIRAVGRAAVAGDERLRAAIARLTEDVGAGGLSDLVATLECEASVRRAIVAPNGVATLADRLARALDLDLARSRDDLIRDALSEILRRRTDLLAVAESLSRSGKRDGEVAQLLHGFLSEPEPEQVEAAYFASFFTQTGSVRTAAPTDGWRKKNVSLATAYDEESVRAQELRERLARQATLDRSCAALHVLGEIWTRFEALKRARGRLDYQDLIEATNRLLGISSAADWVLYKLDGGIDHILLDEAQDTSPEQWQLIDRLTTEFFAGAGVERATPSGRTVFVVGDEKQSIYSFQGAEPRSFADMRDSFEARVHGAKAEWRRLEFLVAFRSCTDILQTVDRVFVDTAATALGAAARIVHAPNRTEAGFVELWEPEINDPKREDEGEPWDAPLDLSTRRTGKLKLAERIAARIRLMLDNKEARADGEPMTPGDIMILVGKRDAFVPLMRRMLKEKGVPVAGVDRIELLEEPAVLDLLAFADFLLLPEDDLTLAVVLKSPVIGYDDDDLIRLAPGRPGSLWAAMQASTEARDREVSRFLATWIERGRTMRPCDLLVRLLESEVPGATCSIRTALLTRLGPDAEEPIDVLLSRAGAFEAREIPTLQGFVAAVRETGGTVKRELEQEQREVRILTVHGAKGLEARVVFLPDTCREIDAAKTSRLLSSREADPLVLMRSTKAAKQDAVTARLFEAERARAENEFCRQLYVAMTRAMDQLYICGAKPGRATGETAPKPGSWYALASAGIKPHAEEIEETGDNGEVLRIWRVGHSPQAATGSAATPPPPPPLPAWIRARAAFEPPRPAILAPSRAGAEGGMPAEPPALSPIAYADPTRFLRGRLIHKLLETLPDRPPANRPAIARAYLSRPGLGLGADDIEEILVSVAAVLDDARFAPVFAAGSEAEVALAGRLPDLGPIAGTIDRLVVAPDRVLVVDYKTNRPPPQHLAGVPPAYRRQLSIYARLLARIYPGRAVEAAIVWTEVPSLMPVPVEM